jgi:hypothetical protein
MPPRRIAMPTGPSCGATTSPDSWLSASLRVTNRTPGAALIFKGLDLREGWIVPRVTVSKYDATGELLTPSASRWADYYVSGGRAPAVRVDAGEPHHRYRAGPSRNRGGHRAQLEDCG